MKLYGSLTSPFVRHIRTMMIILELDYEFINSDYAFSAANSPTKKIPFFEDGDIKLTDSTSILVYIKQQAGQSSFDDAHDVELYTTASTVLDSEINLFLLGMENVNPENTPYMQRQRSRVETGLMYLDAMIGSRNVNYNKLSDGELRTACLLDWALFRGRFEIDAYANLVNFLEQARSVKAFSETSPTE